MSAANCPHCGGTMTEGYEYCQHCGRIAVDFQTCETCAEPMSASASKCPHCGDKVTTEQEKVAMDLELEVTASRLGAFFTGGGWTALIYPPIIKVHNGRIVVTKWSFFGLRTHQQEIQVTRVASVRYTKGIIWGGLLVETFGGACEDISEKGLQQDDAKLMAEQLKACLKD